MPMPPSMSWTPEDTGCPSGEMIAVADNDGVEGGNLRFNAEEKCVGW